jgi:starch-binding outer membrane protein, SusD/RagB family
MKTKIRFDIMTKVFCFLLVTLFIAGCKPLDEPQLGVLDPETFFQTQDDALSALTAAYAPQYGGSQKYYLKSWIVITDIGSDDMGDGFGDLTERKQMDRFKYDASYAELADVWWNAYIIINRASLVVNNVETMPDGKFDSPEIKKRIIAEARFLRAMNYFNLVRLFGDVVFFGDAYDADPVGANDMTRTDVNVIYDFIIAELQKAEPDLWNRELTEKGRATRGAAETLLSKVYLTRAGWRLDSKTGNMVQGDASNYTEAALWLRKLMDEGHYNLRSNYRDVFPAENKDYDQLENNEEHIYFVNCTETNSWFETLLYFGPRLANSSGGYSSFVGEVELTSSFDSADKRKSVTNLDYVLDEFEEKQLLNAANASYWYPGMAIPHIGKYLPDEERYSFPPTGNASGTNYPLMRFSEVLLMYAEAINESQGPTAESIEAFNRVRRRAGLSEWPNVKDVAGNVYPIDQDGFRKAIRQERRWELCFEGIRIFDLRRWGNLEETFKNRALAANPTPQDSIRAENIELKHNLYPIPLGEIQKNPNLTQNPGF